MLNPASYFRRRSLSLPTLHTRYLPILALLALGLLLLAACHRRSPIVGAWEFDREISYATREGNMARALGGLDAEVARQARMSVDADLATYEFGADGSITIRYKRPDSLNGLERGKWTQQGSAVLIATTQKEGPRTGAERARLYQVVGDRLRMTLPDGMVWELKRKKS